MPAVVYPHRVTMLAPRLVLPQGAEYLAPPAALLLYVTIFEHFLRHPRVTFTDPDDWHVTDADERLLTIDHPQIDSVRNDQYGTARRDELIWLELSLDPARPVPVKLGVERFDGKRDEYAAIGQGPLSQLVANCIQQWLAARDLPQPPRPLEAFDANDFGNATRCLFESLRSQQEDGSVNLTVPPKLAVPFLRSVYVSLNLYTYREILRFEPDNPWAIRDMFLDGLHNNGPESRDPIRGALQTAPMFGKLYLSMFGKGVSDDEALHSFAMGTYLIPQNAFAPKDYAYHLDSAGRWEEAWRWAERAVRAVPLMLDAHIVSMAVYDSCRFGERLVDCGHHLSFLENVVERGIVQPDDPGAMNVRLQYSNALRRAGRLDEAIALRAQVLEGKAEKWPQQTKILQQWQSDPQILADAYSAEAHYRGDPARVVEGARAARPTTSSALAFFIDALVSLGKEDLAVLAYAMGRGFAGNPIARLAGARAMILAGRLEDAVENVQYVALRYPQLRWDTALNRVLRLGASRPAQEWEAIVQKKLAMGARRVAKLVARDAADFVPGLEKSQVMQHALAGQQPVAFDPAWLLPLSKALAAYDVAQTDAFFAHYAQPSLPHADAMAVDWAALVPAPHDNDTDETTRARAAKILYVYAGAIARYLAMTTQPPNVLAGGYRQVASDALEMMRGVRGVLPRAVFRAFFEVLEKLAPLVDEWLFDAWLLRFERAMDLEANEAGKLEPLTHGFPRVAALLRGDERIALEYRRAWELSRAQGADPREALALYERSVRAVGGHAASGWSDVAAKALAPEQALDVHLTATHANTGNARACVAAAKILFGAGRPQEALDALYYAFVGTSGDWQRQRLAELAPLWTAARTPIPIDWNQCQTVGMNALNQGNFELAAAAYRWCCTVDSKNEVANKNLGIAYARLGKTFEAIRAFSAANAAEGPLMAAIAMKDAQKWAEATQAYRLASHWFDDAEKWRWMATAAYMAEDSDTAAEAYGRAFAMNPGVLDPSQLHAYATAANEIGDYETGATMAKRLVEGARNDATWASNGMHQMACALLGMKHQGDAVQWAEQALKINPLPENRAAFAETLERAKRGEPHPLKPRRDASPEGRAWKLLEQGDFKQVAAMVDGAPSWKVKRAALDAARFRFESENDVGVTPRALEAARIVATTTYGSLDKDALLARATALAIREDAFFPVDTPCPLGTRLAQREFGQRFEQRSGKPGEHAKAAAQMAQQLVASGAAGDPDPTVFPGGPVPKLSDYVKIMKAMQSGNPMGALKSMGLDMQTYGKVAMAWGQKMAADPTLTAKFSKMMQG